MNNRILLGAITSVGIAFGASVQNVEAFDLTACPSTSPIASATACQYITNPLSAQGNDFADATSVFSSGSSPTKVNVNNVNVASEGGVESFFGISDWELGLKIDDDTNPLIAETGTFDLSDLYNQYGTVMAVFKSGKKTTLVGYLLDGSSSFSWSNPWGALGIDGTKAQDTSHISFYGSGEPIEKVPTPAAVLPILGGLFGAASRRKKGENLAESDA